MIVLFVDTETTGLEAEDEVIEVGAVLYDLSRGALAQAFSVVIQSDRPNGAELINHIPAGVLAIPREAADQMMVEIASVADCIAAHNAEFDRPRLPCLHHKPWLCTKQDVQWPRVEKRGGKLVEIALAHGVGIARAHRALDDCLTLASICDRVHELGGNLTAMFSSALAAAQTPRVQVAAQVSFAEREQARKAGFRWDDSSRRWLRKCTEAERKGFAFGTTEVAA